MKLFLKGCMVAAGVLTLASAASAGDLKISLDHVQARGGTVYIAVQNRDQYMKHAAVTGDMIRDPKDGALTFYLPNVPEGDYAISVLHDENGDREMKREPNGRPLEGWAMVNYSGTGFPDFDRVKVHVAGQGLTDLHASMVYPR